MFVLGFVFTSCNTPPDLGPEPIGSEEKQEIVNPDTYVFERDGASTVSFSGQTTRIEMAEELISAMKDFGVSAEALQEMFANETADGSDANPFSNADLNESTKSIRSKVAASADFFSANTVDGTAIKADFDSWIAAQVAEVFPNEMVVATAGVAGQILDGSSTRYVNGMGLEYNQAVNKGLIGALMTDQALNNYIGTAVLDAADNIDANSNKVNAEGKSYTNMEHKWDEAYGYVYGTATDTADPNPTIGSDDSFLNKYIGRVESDADFAGIAADIWEAFKLGRAAIVANDYEVRDEQADIIKIKISTVIAVRAVYYLQSGKNALANENLGAAFHDLSEGLGFVYSLQFTRAPKSNLAFFTKAEVDNYIGQLLNPETNGFWGITAETLDAMSEEIANRFGFTVAQAAG